MSTVQLVSLAQRLGQESHKLPAGSLRDSGPCGCEGDHCTRNIAVVNQSLWEGWPAKTSVSPRSSPLWTFRAEERDVPPRETSPATRSGEKRMFSQAMGRVTDACLVFVKLICLPYADWLPPRVLIKAETNEN